MLYASLIHSYRLQRESSFSLPFCFSPVHTCPELFPCAHKRILKHFVVLLCFFFFPKKRGTSPWLTVVLTAAVWQSGVGSRSNEETRRGTKNLGQDMKELSSTAKGWWLRASQQQVIWRLGTDRVSSMHCCRRWSYCRDRPHCTPQPRLSFSGCKIEEPCRLSTPSLHSWDKGCC